MYFLHCSSTLSLHKAQPWSRKGRKVERRPVHDFSVVELLNHTIECLGAPSSWVLVCGCEGGGWTWSVGRWLRRRKSAVGSWRGVEQQVVVKAGVVTPLQPATTSRLSRSRPLHYSLSFSLVCFYVCFCCRIYAIATFLAFWLSDG